jgi:twitching motility protein PilT
MSTPVDDSYTARNARAGRTPADTRARIEEDDAELVTAPRGRGGDEGFCEVFGEQVGAGKGDVQAAFAWETSPVDEVHAAPGVIVERPAVPAASRHPLPPDDEEEEALQPSQLSGPAAWAVLEERLGEAGISPLGRGPAAPSGASGEPTEADLASRFATLGTRVDDTAVAAPVRLVDETSALINLHIDDLLRFTVERKSSDLHLTEGLSPMLRIDGRLVRTDFPAVSSRDIQRLVYEVLSDSQIQNFEKNHELDFSYGLHDVGRFRFNLYRQRGAIGAAMRSIPSRIPTIEELRLPPILRELTRRPSGLVLVTGATGAGKSTSLAALIGVINQERACHVVTIEDPIEYVHAHGRAMIHQRELGADTHSFPNALRAVLREDPDVILVGEMRDLETIAAAITLAETGHLVFATLHTRNAPQTIDRIVDVFPPHQQDQIKVQLANSLEAVLAQMLLPRLGGGRVAAMEIMMANSAVRNLIREGKTAQLYSCIETGSQIGMQTMDRALVDLYRMGLVGHDVAVGASLDRDNFLRLLKTH